MLLSFPLNFRAIQWRERSDFHKRLMLLATAGIILPAITRLPIGEFAGSGLFYACVLVPVIVDTVRLCSTRLRISRLWSANACNGFATTGVSRSSRRNSMRADI